MNESIKDPTTLKKILWLDAILGGTTALIGLIFFSQLTAILGLSSPLILVISIITLLYAGVAFSLANQKSVRISFLRILVLANWLWTFISIILFLLYYNKATALGLVFLILQILVVGSLAYWEGSQMVKKLFRP